MPPFHHGRERKVMKIIIGSKNPAKITAVKKAFSDSEVEWIFMDIPSGVSEQPFSDDETIKGAKNRALNALKEGNGVFGIGLEGGVQETSSGLMSLQLGSTCFNRFGPDHSGRCQASSPGRNRRKAESGRRAWTCNG